MKYAIAGVALTAALLAGNYAGQWMREWLGTGGSLLAWMGIAGCAYVVIRYRGEQRG